MLARISARSKQRSAWDGLERSVIRHLDGHSGGLRLRLKPAPSERAREPHSYRITPRFGIQVNGHLIWRISSRKSGFQLAALRRDLTLFLSLFARTKPRAKRRTTAMFFAPWPVR
jgi:hypothetical protein